MRMYLNGDDPFCGRPDDLIPCAAFAPHAAHTPTGALREVNAMPPAYRARVLDARAMLRRGDSDRQVLARHSRFVLESAKETLTQAR